MRSSMFVSVLVVWGCFFRACLSAGETRYYDEFLWSKRNWPEYTLAFPYRSFLFGKQGGGGLESSGFSEFIRGYRESLQNGRYESTMMDGGYDNVVEYLVRDGAGNLGEQERRAGDVMQIRMHAFGQQQQHDSVVNKILQGGLMVSDILECDVQESLNEILWPVVANWTLSQGTLLKDSDVVDVAEEACSVEVPADILKDRMLIQIVLIRAGDIDEARSSGTVGDVFDSVNDRHVIDKVVEILKHSHDDDWKNALAETLNVKYSALEHMLAKKGSMLSQQILGTGSQDQEYYLALTTRDAQHASPVEISTVTSACLDTLSNKEWKKSIMEAQQVYLTTALGVIDFMGSDESNSKSSSPRLDRSCINFHPQCDTWAKKGECIANPKYMVGTKRTGQCRLACGVCEKRDLEALPSYLSARNAQFLEDIYLETSSSLASKGCFKSGKGPMSEAKETLSGILRQHSSSHANIADRLLQARGPITLKTVSPDSLDQIKVLDSTILNRVSTHQNAVVKLPETLPHYPLAVQPNDQDSSDTPRSLLWQALENKCLYKTIGYWSYQICHGVSVEQYHTADPSILTPEWSIQLGTFEPTTSSFDIVETEASLYDRHHIPSVLHIYDGGSECTVDEKEYDEEFDKGRPEKRKSMVYFMCSPDVQSHMTVKETSRCVYRIEVYLPELCHSKKLAVGREEPEEETSNMEEILDSSESEGYDEEEEEEEEEEQEEDD